MSSVQRRPWLVAALVAAVIALVGSIAFAATATERGSGHSRSWGAVTTPGSMMRGLPVGGRSPMMAGAAALGHDMGYGMSSIGLAGNGVVVTSIASARQRAALAGGPSGLHPGEVIWFDNGFYVELKDASGTAATEVIVDLVTGSVGTEPGPAMMWNTRFGMRYGTDVPATPAVSAAQAQQIAARWLHDQAPGRVATTADIYPGYYTLETTTGGHIDGMLSVNATSGAVWPHTWHGRFLAKEDR